MESLKKLRAMFDAYRPPTETLRRGGPTLSKADVAGLLADQEAADAESKGAVRRAQYDAEGEAKPGARVTFGADTIYGKGGSKESDYEPAVESMADYKRRLMMGMDEPTLAKKAAPPARRPAPPQEDVMEFEPDEIKGPSRSEMAGGPSMAGSAFARLLKKLEQ